MRTSRLDKRCGFTLVEMLVVIIIILILATLTVAITPKIAGEQKVAKAADQVQGWFLIAKSRAKRDQIPTGIRLIPDVVNPANIRELQYVQQPDDFVGGKVALVVDFANKKLSVAAISGVDFTGGFTIAAAQPVQAGDYFEIKGGGSVHLIIGVRANALDLLWKDPPPHGVQTPTDDYRIIRKPRALIGETPMLLAQDMVIDTKSNVNHGNVLPGALGTPIDILFAPSGSLVQAPGSNSFLALWLRDVTADPPAGPPQYPAEFGGNSVVICIYKRAGFIAAHPVDVTDYDSGPGLLFKPYTFATDGKSSGL